MILQAFPHHSVQHGGVCCAWMVRCVGQSLGQVTRAVQRVCVCPLLKRLLPIEEQQLERHCSFLERGEIKEKAGWSPVIQKKWFSFWEKTADILKMSVYWSKSIFMLHSRNSCVTRLFQGFLKLSSETFPFSQISIVSAESSSFSAA